MEKIIVTGGAGFIGSHIVDALIVLDGEVVVRVPQRASTSQRAAADGGRQGACRVFRVRDDRVATLSPVEFLPVADVEVAVGFVDVALREVGSGCYASLGAHVIEKSCV